MKKDGKRWKISERIKKFRHKEIIIFSLVMFIIYLLTLSRSWDDEDSIFFIRGVREFNVAEYQPHPPGYPVYIFLGKISVFLMKDELLGLTILSAIFGALSLAVFYFLIFEMYGKKTALISTMLMAVTPLFWLNSLKAMSDIPGLFFILLSMYFIYHFIKYKEIKSLYIGSFVSAIAIGLRFHALFVVAPLLIYSCFKMKGKEDEKNLKKVRDKKNKKERKRGKLKKIFYALVFFLIGILVWLVPTLIINGFVGYFGTILDHFLWISGDSKISVFSGELASDSFFLRTKSFFRFFLGEGYGIDLLELSILPVITLLIYLSFLFLSYDKLKDKRILFFVPGLVFYLLYTFLFLPPHNPRYLLPLIPFISLLFVLGVSWFGKFDKLAFVFLLVLLIAHSVPLAAKIHTTEAPSVELISYIKENYSLEEIFIFRDTITHGYLKYYNIKSVHFDDADEYNVTKISENKTVLFINPKHEQIKEYNLALIKIFQRDFRVHSKQGRVSLYSIKENQTQYL